MKIIRHNQNINTIGRNTLLSAPTPKNIAENTKQKLTKFKGERLV